MSVGHYTQPYPSHFDPQKCKRCKEAMAEVYVIAQREGRSGNLREFTSGPYCRPCARLVIAEAQGREHRKRAAGSQRND